MKELDGCFLARMLCALLIQNCPKDQYNLVSTIGFKSNSNGEWSVYIGGDRLKVYAKAPYAKFTNEPRKDGKILHYRKVQPGNQLTGWIDRTVEQFQKVVMREVTRE